MIAPAVIEVRDHEQRPDRVGLPKVVAGSHAARAPPYRTA